ncbi:MAG: fimbrillin family protein [Rikenellaceae bacterium]
MNRLYIIILLFGGLFTACSDSNVDLTNGLDSDRVIAIDPIIMSRATELDFEGGDKIGITILKDNNTPYLDNISLTYSGSIFSGSHVWYDSTDITSTIVAYYPYLDGDTVPTSFTIKGDQSVDGAYAASDLMMATKSGVHPSNAPILMCFNHMLCKMVVKLDNQSGKGIESVIVGDTRSRADIDVVEQSILVDTSSDKIDIIASSCDDGTYKMIFVPQSTSLSFTIVYDDKSQISGDYSEYNNYLSGGEYIAELLLYENDIEITIDTESVDDDTFQEYSDYFIYHDEYYNTITFSNGIKVMTDNLRYIPDGMTPSDTPADKSGLWYPYSLDIETEETAALTDSESIALWGYFYNHATAFGVEEITEDNHANFEGVQGICPKGWHIPTSEEWYMLCGDSQQYSTDDTSAPFYDSNVYYSSIQRANEMGFNHNYAGAIANDRYLTTFVDTEYTASEYVTDAAESVVGNKSTTYYMSSTSPNWSGVNSGATFYSLMTSHATLYEAKGRISISLGYSGTQGQSIRCVKD